MKFQLGIAACLLAGCATQPAWGHRTQIEPGPNPGQTAQRDGGGNPTSPPTARLAITTGPPTTLRIGVEFLPPERETRAAIHTVIDRPASRARETRVTATPNLVERCLVPEARHTWALSTTDLEAIDNPFARETLRFMDDMVREDRRRTLREVRLPFLERWQPDELELSQPLWSEQTIAEARAEWVHDNGPRVLSRPFRRLLRRFPLVTDLELRLDDFRSSFVPMSRPYRQTHTRHRSLGRLSMRLHASNLGDPVEIVYINSGVRLGSSQERGKLALDVPLSPDLELTVRTHYDYFTSQSHLRADLAYRLSQTASLRFAVGNDMDFLSTSSIYSLFEAPMDGSPGLLMYAVHVF
ncbi:MAG: hypothetical protein NXI31_26595 [bacterium]|nr:hypothetical protein [bacterium]